MNLCVSFAIECSHTIEEPHGVPSLHGHSYVLTIGVRSSAESPCPLPMLQERGAAIRDKLDHRHLNDVLHRAPTMEAIVEFIRREWQGPPLTLVRVARPTLGASAEWSA